MSEVLLMLPENPEIERETNILRTNINRIMLIHKFDHYHQELFADDFQKRVNFYEMGYREFLQISPTWKMWSP